MATVKFSNGATINFNGTPTQQDIDYVAAQMQQQQGGQQQQQPQGQSTNPVENALGTLGTVGNFAEGLGKGAINAGQDIAKSGMMMVGNTLQGKSLLGQPLSGPGVGAGAGNNKPLIPNFIPNPITSALNKIGQNITNNITNNKNIEGQKMNNPFAPQGTPQKIGNTIGYGGAMASQLLEPADALLTGGKILGDAEETGGLLGMFKGTPEENAIKNITPDIDEVKDPQMRQVLKNADPETTFSKGKVNLSPNLEKTATTYSELLQGTPTENYQNVIKESSETMSETKDMLKGKTFDPTDLEKNINEFTSKVKPPSTMSQMDWNEKIGQITQNILEQNAKGDAADLGEYSLKYKADNQGALDQLYGGATKSSNQLIDSILQAMNKTINDEVPGYEENVQKMKDLKQLSDWLQPQAETSVSSSKLGSFIKKHPQIEGAAKLGLGTAAYEGAKHTIAPWLPGF